MGHMTHDLWRLILLALCFFNFKDLYHIFGFSGTPYSTQGTVEISSEMGVKFKINSFFTTLNVIKSSAWVKFLSDKCFWEYHITKLVIHKWFIYSINQLWTNVLEFSLISLSFKKKLSRICTEKTSSALCDVCFVVKGFFYFNDWHNLLRQ